MRKYLLSLFVLTLLISFPFDVQAQTVSTYYPNPSSYERPTRLDDVRDLPQTGGSVPVTVTTVSSTVQELPQTGVREVIWMSAALIIIVGLYFKRFGQVVGIANPQSIWQSRQLNK
jgi:hypothetical protein